jgi:hypothetical protein
MYAREQSPSEKWSMHSLMGGQIQLFSTNSKFLGTNSSAASFQDNTDKKGNEKREIEQQQ